MKLSRNPFPAKGLTLVLGGTGKTGRRVAVGLEAKSLSTKTMSLSPRSPRPGMPGRFTRWPNRE